MTQDQYFLWLAFQAFSGLKAYWAVTLFLAAAVAFTTLVGFRSGRRELRGRALMFLATLLVPIAMIAVGTLLARTDRWPLDHIPWSVYAVYGLLGVQLFASIIMVVKSRGVRWAAASWSAFSLWCSVWAGFVSIMSLTNDWV